MKITVNINNGYLTVLEPDKLKELKDGNYMVELSNIDLRTQQQNKAVHAWFNMISSELNKSGLYVANVIKFETLWTPEKVKELIFKPVLEFVSKKKSTTQMTKEELQLVQDSVIQALASKGVDVPPFPSIN